jgi:hypothetical protein
VGAAVGYKTEILALSNQNRKMLMTNRFQFPRQTAAVLMACGLIASLLPGLAAGQDGATGSMTDSQYKELPPPIPDFKGYRLQEYNEDFFNDHFVCGEQALRYMVQSTDWRSNPEGKPEKYSKIQRLLSGDTLQVSEVNKEIRNECLLVLSRIREGTENKNNRTLMAWIDLALRVPDVLEPETHKLIRETLKAYNVASPERYWVSWINVPGANGSNAHDYLYPLTLAPALIDDPEAVDAAREGLRSELGYMNNTRYSKQPEFNLLESHWYGTSSGEMIKKFTPDPYLRRGARMISERLWIDRFLTWSAEMGRNTGPGSRMAPSEWLGTDGERLLFATALSKPIWLNVFFDWEVWDPRNFRQRSGHSKATVPDLPEYLQDIAWRKSYPNEFQSMIPIHHWDNYPELPRVPQGDPLRPAKYVNYQAQNYTLGSTTASWVVNKGVVAASAWWNNSRNPEAPVGSPERFCVLYPHYVFNGMSCLDKGYLFFEDNPDQPLSDHKGGPGGPWMREFIDYGRVGTVQDRNTLLLSYTPKPATHNKGNLVKDKTFRASAAMYLFRWTEGTEGLYVNREPVTSLPRELQPGDWWFIEDGEVYAAVRPLKATALKWNCRTILEKRTRHIVLYQDNVNAENIKGISNEDWVKAQSGFIVEMGNKQEYGSFSNFRDLILSGEVTTDEVSGYDRHIEYERDDRKLEMKWHCFTEKYAMRQISGKDDPWPQFLKSPEFSVDNSGSVKVHDATLKTTEGNTAWLLSCSPSKTWVAYQSQFDKDLPLELNCPAGRFYTERMPFGKVVIHQKPGNKVNIEIDAGYHSGENIDLSEDEKSFTLYFSGTESQLEITINGIAYHAKKIKRLLQNSFEMHSS